MLKNCKNIFMIPKSHSAQHALERIHSWILRQLVNGVEPGFNYSNFMVVTMSLITFKSCLLHYTPHTTKLLGGILVSLRPSVRPASRVRSVSTTVLVGSFSYLYILSSNFRRCVSCKVFCKTLKLEFLVIFLICKFDFVLFWLGIWCESLVSVIMGGGGYLRMQVL